MDHRLRKSLQTSFVIQWTTEAWKRVFGAYLWHQCQSLSLTVATTKSRRSKIKNNNVWSCCDHDRWLWPHQDQIVTTTSNCDQTKTNGNFAQLRFSCMSKICHQPPSLAPLLLCGFALVLHQVFYHLNWFIEWSKVSKPLHHWWEWFSFSTEKADKALLQTNATIFCVFNTALVWSSTKKSMTTALKISAEWSFVKLNLLHAKNNPGNVCHFWLNWIEMAILKHFKDQGFKPIQFTMIQNILKHCNGSQFETS